MEYDTIEIEFFIDDNYYFRDKYISISKRHISGYTPIRLNKIKDIFKKYNFNDKHIIFDDINDNDVLYCHIDGNRLLEPFFQYTLNNYIYDKISFKYKLFCDGHFVIIKKHDYTRKQFENLIRKDKLKKLNYILN